jgi:hypothetical protein
VHFSNKVFGRSIDVDVVDGVAVIPDILLQTDKELTAWAFVGTAENGYTKISKVFRVNKRNKPADYVFTEPDQTTLGEILDRIENLENRPSGDVSKEDIQNAVNDYLDKNPVSFEEKDPTVPAWAKQPERPTYTAAEVGALSADTVIPDGGIPIPNTASVGQTVVVKAVDENGKPTEWEVADFPSGGDKWEFICDITTTEKIDAGIEITENSEGIQLSELKYNEIWIMAKMVGVNTNTDNWWTSKCYGHPMGIGQDYKNMGTNGASSGGTTGTRYVSYYHFIRGNKLYWNDSAKTDVFNITGGDQAWLTNYLDNYHFDYFNKVVIEAASSKIIGVDTEIRILGRRT